MFRFGGISVDFIDEVAYVDDRCTGHDWSMMFCIRIYRNRVRLVHRKVEYGRVTYKMMNLFVSSDRGKKAVTKFLVGKAEVYKFLNGTM